MPGPPCWRVKQFTLDKAPLEPQTLYWHDPVECTQFLFQNLNFNGHMVYAPSHMYNRNESQRVRVYMEMMTGEEWHYQQVHITITDMMLSWPGQFQICANRLSSLLVIIVICVVWIWKWEGRRSVTSSLSCSLLGWLGQCERASDFFINEPGL